MPLYVSFRRALRGHITIWYEPLEEDNVGHGDCHEVTSDVYKHITAPAQRRLSIERAGAKDGAFLAIGVEFEEPRGCAVGAGSALDEAKLLVEVHVAARDEALGLEVACRAGMRPAQ